MLAVIVSVFLFALLLLSMDSVLVYASSTSPQAPATTTEGQPKPGIILIITFENGTTKAIHSDSTDLKAVNGGYFIADPSVKPYPPLQSKTVSNTVVQKLVSVFVDVSIVDEASPTSSEGCGEGYGYYVGDPNPICEPLDKIGQGPPPDQAFCAALGCPYNPPSDSELPVDDSEINNDNTDFATTPVTPTEIPASESQPPPEPEPDPGNEDQSEEQDTQNNEESGGNGGGGDVSQGGDDSEEEEEK